MDKRETKDKNTRRRHGDAFKQELVERSLQPGASVSALAQEHGVNANLLFNWRRLHLHALAVKPAASLHPALLPVTVVPELPIAAPPPAAPPARAQRHDRDRDRRCTRSCARHRRRHELAQHLARAA